MISTNKGENYSAPLDWRKRHAFLFKTVAFIVIFAFLLYDITWAQGGTPIWQHAKTGDGVTHPEDKINDISLPYNAGKIEEIYPNGGEKAIINIQDSHASLSAQDSIVKILDSLVTDYDLNLIAVEGSEGYIDTSILRTFPDKEIKKKTARYLMKKGKMSAGEFFTIVSDKEIALYGIENDELYKKNVELFKSVIEDRITINSHIQALEKALQGLEDRIYRKGLKEFIRASALHKSGKLSFSGYWNSISNLAKNNGIGTENYENITKLLNTLKLEKEINFSRATAERKALIDELSKNLAKEKMEKLLLLSLSFKMGKISQTEFHRYLVNLAEENNIGPAPYKNLINFTRYISIYEGIDIFALYSEVGDLESAIREKLFTTEDERALYDFQKKTRILKGLFNVKLTNGDVDYLIQHKDEFRAKDFAGFIRRNYRKYNLVIEGGYDLGFIMGKVDEAIEFYNVAQERNSSMLRNTILRMKEEKKSVAALITGGFHSKGLTSLMKEKGLSYLVVMPKFEGEKNRPYITILTNKKQPYEELIRKGEYELAVHQYYSTGNLTYLIGSFAMPLIEAYREKGEEGLEEAKKFWKNRYESSYKSLSESRSQALAAERLTPEEFNNVVDEFTPQVIGELSEKSDTELEEIPLLRNIAAKHAKQVSQEATEKTTDATPLIDKIGSHERLERMWGNKFRITSTDDEILAATSLGDKFALEGYKAISQFIPDKAESVCEIGFGSGKFLIKWAEDNPAGVAYGVDLTDGAIATATKAAQLRKLSNISFIKENMFTLSFDDNLFDCVFSEGVLEHYKAEDIELAIQEMIRITRPGGKVVIAVPNYYSPTVILAFLLNGIDWRNVEKNKGYEKWRYEYEQPQKARDLKKIFKNSGFTDIKFSGWGTWYGLSALYKWNKERQIAIYPWYSAKLGIIARLLETSTSWLDKLTNNWFSKRFGYEFVISGTKGKGITRVRTDEVKVVDKHQEIVDVLKEIGDPELIVLNFDYHHDKCYLDAEHPLNQGNWARFAKEKGLVKRVVHIPPKEKGRRAVNLERFRGKKVLVTICGDFFSFVLRDGALPAEHNIMGILYHHQLSEIDKKTREEILKPLRENGIDILKPVVFSRSRDYIFDTEGYSDDVVARVKKEFSDFFVPTAPIDTEKLKEKISHLIAKREWQELVKSGKPPVQFLIETLQDQDKGWNVREAVARALGEIGDEKAVQPLIEVLLNKDEYDTVCEAAAEALGEIGDKRAVEPLVKALEDSRYRKGGWSVRKSAAIALGEIGRPAVQPLIEALLKSKKDEDVRTSAATALGKISDKEAVQPLIKALLKDSDRSVRKAAAEALGEIGDKQAVEPLIETLQDQNEDWYVRKAAVEALGKIGNKEAVQPLIKALLKDSDRSVREAAAEALGEIGDKRAVESLIKALNSGNVCQPAAEALEKLGALTTELKIKRYIHELGDGRPVVRQTAVEELVKIGEPAVQLLIETLLKKDKVWWVREKIVEILGKIGDKRAIDALIKALLKDNNYRVCKTAARALGKIGDERAIEPLIKALEYNWYVREAAMEALEKLGALTTELKIRKYINDLATSEEAAKEWHFPLSDSIEALVKIGKPDAPAVIEALKSENKNVCKHAAQILGEIADERAIEPLIKALEYNWYVREAAMEALEKLGALTTELKIRKYINDLTTNEKIVREWHLPMSDSIEAMVKIGEPVVQPLIGMLKSESKAVIKHITRILGEIGDERAIEPLIEALKSKEIRPWASGALAKIGQPAVPSLIAALKDKDSNVRQHAAITLGEIGDERAVPHLIEALKDKESDVRQTVTEALDNLNWEPQTEQEKISYFIAKLSLSLEDWAVLPLIKIGQPAVPSLIAALKDKNIYVRTNAAYTLGKIGDERAVPHLIEALEDENKNVRAGAAYALGEIGDERAIPHLIETLKDEESDIRTAAAWALGEIGDERAVPHLIEALKDKESDVCQHAAEALGKIGDKRAAPYLIDRLKKDNNEWVRHAAATALGEIGDERAIPHLIEALEDEESYVRKAAKEALVQIGQPAIPFLIEALKDKESDVRKAAARALGKIGQPAIPFLIEALKDEESYVRQHAAEALGEIGDERAVPHLIETLKDEESDVCTAAAWALGEIGDERAVPHLIEALEDKNKNVRSGAAEALGKIPSKEAVLPLIVVLLETTEDSSVRRAAAIALGEIGDKQAVRPLILVLTDSKNIAWLREGAKDALVQIGEHTYPILIDYLLESKPDLTSELGKTLLSLLGPQAFIYLFIQTPLPEAVSVGGKLWPGSDDKKLLRPTTSPKGLAGSIKPLLTRSGELQVSVGIDFGEGSYRNRCKFIALALFIASTDIDNFRALEEAPERDLGASYGIVIRGIRVDPVSAVNRPNHRLDYIFPVSEDTTEGNLREWITAVQMLNLGAFLASVEEGYYKLASEPHPLLADQHRKIIALYREFESGLIKILRSYNKYRSEEAICPVDEYDSERVEASSNHLLEKALYPGQEWLADLEKEDTIWNDLLPYLRAHEAIVLMREADEGEEPVGDRYMNEVKKLLFETYTGIQDVINNPAAVEPISVQKAKDPFIDTGHPQYTEKYAKAMVRGLKEGTVKLEELPNPQGIAWHASKGKTADINKVIALDKPSSTTLCSINPFAIVLGMAVVALGVGIVLFFTIWHKFFPIKQKPLSETIEYQKMPIKATRRETTPRKEPAKVPHKTPRRKKPQPQPQPQPAKPKPVPVPKPIDTHELKREAGKGLHLAGFLGVVTVVVTMLTAFHAELAVLTGIFLGYSIAQRIIAFFITRAFKKSGTDERAGPIADTKTLPDGTKYIHTHPVAFDYLPKIIQIIVLLHERTHLAGFGEGVALRMPWIGLFKKPTYEKLREKAPTLKEKTVTWLVKHTGNKRLSGGLAAFIILIHIITSALTNALVSSRSALEANPFLAWIIETFGLSSALVLSFLMVIIASGLIKWVADKFGTLYYWRCISLLVTAGVIWSLDCAQNVLSLVHMLDWIYMFPRLFPEALTNHLLLFAVCSAVSALFVGRALDSIVLRHRHKEKPPAVEQPEKYPTKLGQRRQVLKSILLFVGLGTVGSLVLSSCKTKETPSSKDLSEEIKQQVKGLGYSDKVARDFVKMVRSWKDREGRPVLAVWEQKLTKARQDYKQGKISKGQLAGTEGVITNELSQKIRKEINVNMKSFHLADVIKERHAQCLGHTQLLYILGSFINLSVTPINVVELRTAAPLLPTKSGYVLEHIACIINLADDKVIMADSAMGFVSKPFIIEEQYEKAGNYRKLKDKDNPLGIHRRIQMLDKNGLIASIYFNLATTYTILGQHEKVISYFKRAIELNPEYAEAYTNLAVVYEVRGQYKEAIFCCEKAIELNPEYARAYYNFAIVYDTLRRPKKAIPYYIRAIKLNPEFSWAHNNLGNDYGRLGQHEKALTCYNKAIELDPEYVNAYKNRGITHAFLEEPEEARKDLLMAVKLDPALKANVKMLSDHFGLNLKLTGQPIGVGALKLSFLIGLLIGVLFVAAASYAGGIVLLPAIFHFFSVIYFAYGILQGATAFFIKRAFKKEGLDWKIAGPITEIKTNPDGTKYIWRHAAFRNLPEPIQELISAHEMLHIEGFGELMAYATPANAPLMLSVVLIVMAHRRKLERKKRKEAELGFIKKLQSENYDSRTIGAEGLSGMDVPIAEPAKDAISNTIVKAIDRNKINFVATLIKGKNKTIRGLAREIVKRYANKPEHQFFRDLIESKEDTTKLDQRRQVLKSILLFVGLGTVGMLMLQGCIVSQDSPKAILPAFIFLVYFVTISVICAIIFTGAIWILKKVIEIIERIYAALQNIYKAHTAKRHKKEKEQSIEEEKPDKPSGTTLYSINPFAIILAAVGLFYAIYRQFKINLRPEEIPGRIEISKLKLTAIGMILGSLGTTLLNYIILDAGILSMTASLIAVLFAVHAIMDLIMSKYIARALGKRAGPIAEVMAHTDGTKYIRTHPDFDSLPKIIQKLVLLHERTQLAGFGEFTAYTLSWIGLFKKSTGIEQAVKEAIDKDNVGYLLELLTNEDKIGRKRAMLAIEKYTEELEQPEHKDIKNLLEEFKRQAAGNALITGGAGYTGSELARYLIEKGENVWILDDESTGHEMAVPDEIKDRKTYIKGDICDRELLKKIIEDNKIDVVYHLAAKTLMNESMEKPALYYYTNVIGTLAVCDAIREIEAKDPARRIALLNVSTCGLYDDSAEEITKGKGFSEKSPVRPIAPYTESKLLAEILLEHYQKEYGVEYISIRPFNIVGASEDGEYGEDTGHATHLITVAGEVVRDKRDAMYIFGDDWDTSMVSEAGKLSPEKLQEMGIAEDKTAVREYISARDTARLCFEAANYMKKRIEKRKPVKHRIFNAGTGIPLSALKVIAGNLFPMAVKMGMIEKEPAIKFGPRREGDDAVKMADMSLVKKVFAWIPDTPIAEIARTHLLFLKKKPRGYDDKETEHIDISEEEALVKMTEILNASKHISPELKEEILYRTMTDLVIAAVTSTEDIKDADLRKEQKRNLQIIRGNILRDLPFERGVMADSLLEEFAKTVTLADKPEILTLAFRISEELILDDYSNILESRLISLQAFKSREDFERFIPRRLAELLKGHKGEAFSPDLQNTVNEYPGTIGRSENVHVLKRDLDTQEAAMLVLEGNVVSACIFAGAATRAKVILGGGSKFLFNPGSIKNLNADDFKHAEPKLDISTIRIIEGAQKLPYIRSIMGISLGARIFIQYRATLEEIARKYKYDAEEAVKNAKFVVHVNDISVDDIIMEFEKYDFFGFDPENIMFIIQPTYEGYLFVSGEPIKYTKEIRKTDKPWKRPFGHGTTLMQLVMPNQGFVVSDGKKIDIEEAPLKYFRNRFPNVNLVQNFRIEDLTELTEKGIIDLDKLALRLKLREKGHFAVSEIVDNVTGQKGASWHYSPDDPDRSFLVETLQIKNKLLVQHKETREYFYISKADFDDSIYYKITDDDEIRRIFKEYFLMSKNANTYDIDALLKYLPRKPLKNYLDIRRDEQAGNRTVAFTESITGDITQIAEMNTAAINNPGEAIEAFKGPGELIKTLRYIHNQDKNKNFRKIVYEILVKRANNNLRTGRYIDAIKEYETALNALNADLDLLAYMRDIYVKGNPHEQVVALQVLSKWLKDSKGKNIGISSKAEDHKKVYRQIAFAAGKLGVKFEEALSRILSAEDLKDIPSSDEISVQRGRAPPIKIMLASLFSHKYPAIYEPLGTEIISGEIIKGFGYKNRATVNLFDMQHPANEDIDVLIKAIKDKKPRVLGLSLKLGTYEEALQILSRIYSDEFRKEERPIVILGGSIPTYATEEILADYPEAICVIGEGEFSIRDLIEALEKGGDLQALLKDVRNIAYVDEDGSIYKTRRVAIEMKDIAVADRRSLIELLEEENANIIVQSSQGCPFRCTFCEREIFRLGSKRRLYPVERVVNELEDLAMLGVTEIGFIDEDFINLGFKPTVKLAEAILARKTDNPLFNINFYVSTRVDAIYNTEDSDEKRVQREEMWRLLRLAGLRRVFIGVESGSETQLNRYNKRIDLAETREALNLLKELDIEVEPGFIMFDPLMSLEEVKENIAFIEETGLDETGVRFTHYLRAQRQTEYADMLKKKGMLLENEFDIDMVNYKYKYKDQRVKKLVGITTEWVVTSYPLSVAIQSIIRADSVHREALSDNVMKLHDYLIAIRKLELGLLKELVKGEQIADAEKIKKILSDFNNKRLKLVKELKTDLMTEVIKDPTKRGILLKEIDKILGPSGIKEKPIVIAIDGPVAAGKTTVGIDVADRLGIGFFSYGKIYRLTSWFVMQKGVTLKDKMSDDEVFELTRVLKEIDPEKFEIKRINKEYRYFYDGKDITEEIDSREITSNAPFISQLPKPRLILLKYTQTIVRRIKDNYKGIVLEGRVTGTEDITPVDLKIFLTADLRERTTRRAKELMKKKGLISGTWEEFVAEVEEDIEKRDKQDSERGYMPLRPAPDAIIIDTTNLSTAEVVNMIVARASEIPAVISPSMSAEEIWQALYNMDGSELPKLARFVTWHDPVTGTPTTVLGHVHNLVTFENELYNAVIKGKGNAGEVVVRRKDQRVETLLPDKIDTFIDYYRRVAESKNRDRKLMLLRIALALHDIGKVEGKGEDRFAGLAHARPIIEKLIEKAIISDDEARLVLALIFLHDTLHTMHFGESIPAGINEYLTEHNVDKTLYYELALLLYIFDIGSVGKGVISDIHLDNALFYSKPENVEAVIDNWAEIRLYRGLCGDSFIPINFSSIKNLLKTGIKTPSYVLPSIEYLKKINSQGYNDFMKRFLAEITVSGHAIYIFRHLNELSKATPERSNNPLKLLYLLTKIYTSGYEFKIVLFTPTKDDKHFAEILDNVLNRVSINDVKEMFEKGKPALDKISNRFQIPFKIEDEKLIIDTKILQQSKGVLKYPNPRDGNLELDVYDRERYVWDENTGYWRSKDYPRLVLGTWEDVKQSTKEGAAPTDMENHVAIRMASGYTIYVFDAHSYSKIYLKEAEARGEIDRHGNKQIWIDDHSDLTESGEPDDSIALDIAKEGWVGNHIWVYFDSETWGRGKEIHGPLKKLTNLKIESNSCHYSRYFELDTRPRNAKTIFNIDTDAAESQPILDFIKDARNKDGVIPSTVHISTSPPNVTGDETYGTWELDGLAYPEGYGTVERCKELAKGVPSISAELRDVQPLDAGEKITDEIITRHLKQLKEQIDRGEGHIGTIEREIRITDADSDEREIRITDADSETQLILQDALDHIRHTVTGITSHFREKWEEKAFEELGKRGPIEIYVSPYCPWTSARVVERSAEGNITNVKVVFSEDFYNYVKTLIDRKEDIAKILAGRAFLAPYDEKELQEFVRDTLVLLISERLFHEILHADASEFGEELLAIEQVKRDMEFHWATFITEGSMIGHVIAREFKQIAEYTKIMPVILIPTGDEDSHRHRGNEFWYCLDKIMKMEKPDTFRSGKYFAALNRIANRVLTKEHEIAKKVHQIAFNERWKNRKKKELKVAEKIEAKIAKLRKRLDKIGEHEHEKARKIQANITRYVSKSYAIRVRWANFEVDFNSENEEIKNLRKEVAEYRTELIEELVESPECKITEKTYPLSSRVSVRAMAMSPMKKTTGIVIGAVGASEEAVHRINRKIGGVKVIALNENTEEENLRKLEEARKAHRAYASGIVESNITDETELQDVVEQLATTIETEDIRLFALTNPDIIKLDQDTIKDIASIENALLRIINRIPAIRSMKVSELNIYNMRMTSVARSTSFITLTPNATSYIEENKEDRIISITANSLGEAKLLAEAHRQRMNLARKLNPRAVPLKLQVRLTVKEDEKVKVNNKTREELLKLMEIDDVLGVDDLVLIDENTKDTLSAKDIYDKYIDSSKYKKENAAIADTVKEGRTKEEIPDGIVFMEFEGIAISQVYDAAIEAMAYEDGDSMIAGLSLNEKGWFMFLPRIKPEEVGRIMEEVEHYVKKVLRSA